MTRKEGEIVRLREALSRHLALVDSLEVAINHDVPLGEAAVVVVDSAIRLATTAARFDAFMLAEQDAGDH